MLQFSYSDMLLESQGAEEREEGTPYSCRLLNGCGIGCGDVYEISENRII